MALPRLKRRGVKSSLGGVESRAQMATEHDGGGAALTRAAPLTRAEAAHGKTMPLEAIGPS
eukprot:3633491-Pyramimonas_sp.AAC.1